MQYGEKIAALRKANGMTQAELGAKLNVTFQAVSKWERDESLPDFDTMSKIARLFGVPITYFEEDGEEEYESEEEESEAGEENGKMLGVCKRCGRMICEGEEVQTSPYILCKACYENIAAENKAKEVRAAAAKREQEELERRKAENAEREKAFRKAQNAKSANRGLIWAAVIMAPIIIFSIVGIIRDPTDLGNFFLGFAVIVICGYTFIAQLFWDGIVRSITLTGGKLVGMPGVIFSLDLDGIIFLIVVKILFAIIKMIIFIITLLFFVLVAWLVAPFTFVPQLLKCRRGELD